jgi:hypothetical protein
MRCLRYNTPARYHYGMRQPYSVLLGKSAFVAAILLATLGLFIGGPFDLLAIKRLFSGIESSIPEGYHGTGPQKITREGLERVVLQASREFNVHVELLWAVIAAESNFDSNARSRVGAIGLMQLMPDTASSLNVTNPLDPTENIRGGARYLSKLIKDFNGDWQKAIAAYNSGPETVKRYNGVPPFPETRAYVSRVMTLYKLERAKNRPNRLSFYM